MIFNPYAWLKSHNLRLSKGRMKLSLFLKREREKKREKKEEGGEERRGGRGRRERRRGGGRRKKTKEEKERINFHGGIIKII